LNLTRWNPYTEAVEPSWKCELDRLSIVQSTILEYFQRTKVHFTLRDEIDRIAIEEYGSQ
jgi:hypothetical protein